MSELRRPGQAALPEIVEEAIRAVLEAADLELVHGRHEVERELRAHFEDGIDAGRAPEDLVEGFGDPVAAGRRIARARPRAAARTRGEGRWWMKAAEWRTEITRAARRLGRAPGFTAVVVLTLALGVGVNTAIFTVLNAVLLEDLPYPEPDRLVRLYEVLGEGEMESEFLRGPVVTEYRDWDVFDDVATLYTYREVGADLTDGTAPERVTLLRVSAGYFETLGIAPLLGRTFLEDESFGPGEAGSSTEPAQRVVVLSQRLWRDRFGADRDAVGRTLELDGESFEVVGVMPASFRDPFGHQADLWLPQDLRPGGSNHFGNYYLSGIARLRPGLTVDAARERLALLSRSFAERQPEMEGATAAIRPLQSDIVGETRRTMLFILAAAAGLVLLTACVNVANLLFTRGLAQDRALALRSALGSGRGRLIAGILAENGLLAALGGILGLGLGWLGLRVLLATAPDALPMVAEVGFGAWDLAPHLEWTDFEVVDAGAAIEWSGDCTRTPIRER